MCVSLVNWTNRRHWEIRDVCIVKVRAFAWSSFVVVAEWKAVVCDFVVDVDDPFGHPSDIRLFRVIDLWPPVLPNFHRSQLWVSSKRYTQIRIEASKVKY
jgi:hypothetical protein